jgi:hypothetical protein
MQAKDVDEWAILQFLGRQKTSVTHWKLANTTPSLQDAVPGVPEKVLLAKMRSLVRRELVEGCGCGCRGDWKITGKGVALLTPTENPRDRSNDQH